MTSEPKYSAMSSFGSFIKNYSKGGFSPFALLSAISGVSPIKGLSSLYKGYTGAGLTGAQQEAMSFSAEQAQKQMDFQQQMRDSQYQSAVADMKSAGLNPALMYGSGASGNAAPSGAMATSVSGDSNMLDPVGLLGQIANLSLLKAQKENIQANTDKTLAETDLTKTNIVKAGAEISQIKANVNKLGLEGEALAITNRYLDRRENVALQNMSLEGDVLSANWTKIQQEISNLNTEQLKMLQDIKESAERVNYLLSQEALNYSQVNEIVHTIKKIDAETNNIITNTGLTQSDIDYYEWNHATDINVFGYRPGTKQIPKNSKDFRKIGSYKLFK